MEDFGCIESQINIVTFGSSSWCSSISLSSLESENDDPFSSSTANLLGEKRRSGARQVRAIRTGGTSSTHSLNEADLQVGTVLGLRRSLQF